jgi:hypothetical protein
VLGYRVVKYLAYFKLCWGFADVYSKESLVFEVAIRVARRKPTMSSNNKHILDSDASEGSEAEGVNTPEPEDKKDPSPPQSTLSHRFRESPPKTSIDRKREKNSDDSIAVMVPAPARPWEYQPFRGDTTVDTVLETKIMGDKEWYTIEYENGKREFVSTYSSYILA